MKKVICCLILAAIFCSANAQQNCAVLLPQLKGKYTGDCVSGKANGKGEAEGTDVYVGDFKNGLPHGTGIYSYANGNIYQGMFEKGYPQGDGNMTYKIEGKPDSVLSGFFKKGVYVGKYENPYIVHSSTLQVTRVSARKNGASTDNSITITLSNTTGGVPTILGTIMGKATIGNIGIVEGNYTQLMTVNDGPRLTSTKLVDVTFPFRARIPIGNQLVDVQFNEPGAWLLSIILNN